MFAGPNAFSACPDGDRAALRAVLERYRKNSAILEVDASGAAFDTRLPEHGHLYCVLGGRVSLQWENLPAGNGVALCTCCEADLFGELASGLLDLPWLDLGLRACPVASRRTRVALLLEIPCAATAELLRTQSFERALAAMTILRMASSALAWMPLRREPALAVGHFCVVPTCGTVHRLHPTLRYLGYRAAVEKTVTFGELAHLTGFVVNAVRAGLRKLEALGYINAVSERVGGTYVTVDHVDALIVALSRRSLTPIAQ